MGGRIRLAGIGLTALVAVALPATASSGAAGLQAVHRAYKTPPERACQTTIAEGKKSSFFGFCVTANGNIASLRGPGKKRTGTEQIGAGEGYCVRPYKTGYDSELYYDVGGLGAAGWGAPTLHQPGGPNTLPLSITRTSSDGRLRLTQEFEFFYEDRRVDVTISLTELTPSGGVFFLTRVFDGDVNGTPDDDVYSVVPASMTAHDAQGGNSLSLTEYPRVPPDHDLHRMENVYSYPLDRPLGLCGVVYRGVTTPTPPGNYLGFVGTRWGSQFTTRYSYRVR
jgi:hypothetical protein